MNFYSEANIIFVAVPESNLESHCFGLRSDRAALGDAKSILKELAGKAKKGALEYESVLK